MSEDDLAAAEDYRRQRQRADANRNGLEALTTGAHNQWLAEKEPLLRDIIKANGTPDCKIDEVLQEYKDTLTTTSSGSELDDRNARMILDSIVKEIEAVCRDQKIPLHAGVVYGVAPQWSLMASQRTVPSISIVEISLPFIVFCNGVSKAFARTLPHGTGAIVEVSYDPANSLAY